MFRSVVGAYRSTIFPYSQILGYGQPNICEQGKTMERQAPTRPQNINIRCEGLQEANSASLLCLGIFIALKF